MKHLITSALPYINGIKHLGNLVGSMLPADVYARYLRSRDNEVLFICATDEHGAATEIAAAKANIPVEEFCRIQHELQKNVGERFWLSFDYFGRSSSENNTLLTQYIAKKLEENGYIAERTIKQFYSNTDKMFLPDRYVEGTCPHCGYLNARGDQCENCTRVLDPEELINPRSAISSSTDIELKETKHLFLLQSKLADQLETWLHKQDSWPKLVRSIADKWLKEGLLDRAITRDLKWGVPINKPGFENKVFYVWFDAPIAYISTTKDWAEHNGQDWHQWWDSKEQKQGNVRYTQFMAKDNIPFHTITFPSTIIGSGEEFLLPDYIKGVNWLNYYGGKFSTSQKRGIFMDQAINLYPSDYWRYYLMSNIPETDDVSFSWELFASCVNKDLCGVLGNFFNRSFKMLSQYFGTVIPEGGTESEHEEKLVHGLCDFKKEYEHHLDNLEFRKAAIALRNIWKLANEYCDARAPWKASKEGRMEDVAICMRYLVNMQRIISILSAPFIPEFAKITADNLSLLENERAWTTDDISVELKSLVPGREIKDPGILLFNRILPEDVEKYKQKFGSQD
ncbi:MAG: methionine--tRNA ligase [Endomicrobia bacterium]|nr:methionine--tRNA ligase [Endomicrobiia bacterium]